MPSSKPPPLFTSLSLAWQVTRFLSFACFNLESGTGSEMVSLSGSSVSHSFWKVAECAGTPTRVQTTQLGRCSSNAAFVLSY